tara:strand:+ start:2868 stop:3536 length:669 start_codon:yes stop_codon:yes gene_type:complete
MQLKLHKEGWVYFVISLLLAIIFTPFFIIIAIFFYILSIFIFYFFRDPDRAIPYEDVIVSPADGKITYIGMAEPPIDLDNTNKLCKISIFLNIFNVHVNRIPCDGLIQKIKYFHGKFLNATFNKSSNLNERNIVVIKKNNGDLIIVSQIAGLIARRIVSDINENQNVQKGDRFGIIKFGSRVDIYMPLSYKPLISEGQIVLGGETIIANPNNIKEITKSNIN